MRDLVATFLLLLLLAGPSACGVDVEAGEQTLERRIRWQQEPTSEIQDCHVLKLGNERSVEVDRLQVRFGEGSHHVHIYRSSEPVADAVYDCFGGIDWQRWSLVVGAQTEAMDWQLPEGVTIPFAPHQQLLVQVHWLNTTDQRVEPTIDLAFHTTESSQEHLGTLFGVNKRINIAPHERTRVEHFCPLPEGAKLHALMGHFHAHGNDYRVIERMPDQSTGTEIYFAKDEPAFEFKTFAPAHEVPRGAGFQYECGFDNYESFPLTWGSDTKTGEHCNMTAYFSPADGVTQLCLLEPSMLSALTPAQDTVRAGQDLVVVVELAAAEATDVAVELRSSDASVLEVPASITIPAGQLHAAFSAHARRPGRVDVSASMSGTRITTAVRVGGLVLSEVFYNPASATPDQLQWIELANEADVPLDLSPYSLGAGTDDFMTTHLALPTTIPAHGCIVVGGPTSSTENYLPSFALAEALSPNLGAGGARAAGVALFASTVEGLSAALRPLDALVYAGENTTLIGPDGQLAPVWPGAALGGSLYRVNDTVWARSSLPTPGTCEVFDAY
jgi:hypothetical protein